MTPTLAVMDGYILEETHNPDSSNARLRKFSIRRTFRGRVASCFDVVDDQRSRGSPNSWNNENGELDGPD